MRYAGSAVRLMAAVLTLGSLSLVAAGCPEGPQQREATRPARNVSVVTLAPQLMEVQVKLPVTTRPKEVIELRTAIAGTLTGFDFEKGDIVPAGPLPSEVENLSELRPIARSNDKVFTTQLAEAELAFQRAKRANERVVAYGDSTEEQKDAARTQMNLASARIDQLNQQIRNTYVCSPMKGVLTSKLHKKGEFVGSGELIGIVSVLDPIICELFLPESHYSAVKDGDPVDVLFTALQDDGGPATFTGNVSYIDRTADPSTHSFLVEIEIDNESGAIPSGIFGTVHLTVYSNPAALVVPLGALSLEGDQPFVYVIDRVTSMAKKQLVTLGRHSGNDVEILSGVTEGEQIAVMGARSLSDGDKVIVRESSTTPSSSESGNATHRENE